MGYNRAPLSRTLSRTLSPSKPKTSLTTLQDPLHQRHNRHRPPRPRHPHPPHSPNNPLRPPPHNLVRNPQNNPRPQPTPNHTRLPTTQQNLHPKTLRPPQHPLPPLALVPPTNPDFTRRRPRFPSPPTPLPRPHHHHNPPNPLIPQSQITTALLSHPENPATYPRNHNLTYVHAACLAHHAAECAVYSRLKPLQGTAVPEFHASVWVHVNESAGIAHSLVSVPGILIEDVGSDGSDGERGSFLLSEMRQRVPREEWERILRGGALEMLGKVGVVYEVLVEKLRGRNFLVRRRGEGEKNGGYEVVMIDFAQARVRGEDESLEAWRWLRGVEGGEGAIVRIAEELGLKVVLEEGEGGEGKGGGLTYRIE
ncbi:hypothetical protein AJ79_01803 [Helicocarpus griseus UAMH5409]|uniref:Uncharacterized protein n=1 Tax=Helicocarpus griseus UAMH5409 TaxID=1447875 RepID=A0A2B7Y6G9_9EURO|nr:hypothetical protein AJ79_01803 [Helicocarpus griseus UAMH5409]